MVHCLWQYCNGTSYNCSDEKRRKRKTRKTKETRRKATTTWGIQIELCVHKPLHVSRAWVGLTRQCHVFTFLYFNNRPTIVFPGQLFWQRKDKHRVMTSRRGEKMEDVMQLVFRWWRWWWWRGTLDNNPKNSTSTAQMLTSTPHIIHEHFQSDFVSWWPHLPSTVTL